jgi:hypothetical protein
MALMRRKDDPGAFAGMALYVRDEQRVLEALAELQGANEDFEAFAAAQRFATELKQRFHPYLWEMLLKAFCINLPHFYPPAGPSYCSEDGIRVLGGLVEALLRGTEVAWEYTGECSRSRNSALEGSTS